MDIPFLSHHLTNSLKDKLCYHQLLLQIVTIVLQLNMYPFRFLFYFAAAGVGAV